MRVSPALYNTGTPRDHTSIHPNTSHLASAVRLPLLACLILASVNHHELPSRLPAARHRRVPSAGAAGLLRRAPAAGLRRAAAGVPAVPAGRRCVRPAAAGDHQPRRRRLLERMLRRHLLLLRPRHVLLRTTAGDGEEIQRRHGRPGLADRSSCSAI